MKKLQEELEIKKSSTKNKQPIAKAKRLDNEEIRLKQREMNQD
jgi:hypothetical protein